MKRFRFLKSNEEVHDPLLRPLFDDIAEYEQLLDRSDTQFARRAFVRAAFAFNEGYLYWLKGALLNQVFGTAQRTGNIDVTKIALLSDKTYKVDANGRIKAEQNRMPFLNYCAFILRTAAECWGVDPEAIFSDNGWNDMQAALRLRHRITHPKKPEDLEVTDAELRSVSEGHRWLFNCMLLIIRSAPRGPDETKQP
jgi:hypothetical protein